VILKPDPDNRESLFKKTDTVFSSFNIQRVGSGYRPNVWVGTTYPTEKHPVATSRPMIFYDSSWSKQDLLALFRADNFKALKNSHSSVTINSILL